MKLFDDICAKLCKEDNATKLKTEFKKVYDNFREADNLDPECGVCIYFGGISFERRNGDRKKPCEYDGCKAAYCDINKMVEDIKSRFGGN